jgi:hypothetical protein
MIWSLERLMLACSYEPANLVRICIRAVI